MNPKSPAEAPVIIGVNERYYPNEDEDFMVVGKEAIQTLVVLVLGQINDYAAYAGHGSPEWVARHGNKISFEEACCHFPGQLEKSRYRA